MSKISVIIPCYNEEKNIGKCLDSIIDQSYENYEIIVVDNNSTDNSLRIVSTYPVTMLHEPRTHNVSAVRNKGINASEGDIIVTIDADCEIKPGFLEMIAKRFADDSVCTLAFPNSAEYLSEFKKEKTIVPNTKIYYGKPKSLIQKFLGFFYGYHGAPAGFFAFRKSAAKEVKGYDEQMFPFGGEDYDLFFKIVSNYKYNTINPDETKLIKEKRMNSSGFYGFVRWNYRTAEARIKLFIKHKDNMENPIIRLYFYKVFTHMASALLFFIIILFSVFIFSYWSILALLLILFFFYFSKINSKNFITNMLIYGIIGILYVAVTYIVAGFNLATKKRFT